MEDIVAFKRKISKEWGLEGPWVVFGCSYAGLLVTWLKRLYPDEFVGAVVSSAPVEAKVFRMNSRNEFYNCKNQILDKNI